MGWHYPSEESEFITSCEHHHNGHRANADANSTNIVVGTGLGWSIPENIGRLTFETLRCAQQLDHSDRFMYAALRTNLHVLSSVVFAGIFFMWLRSKEKRRVYTSFVAIAMIIFPVLST